MIKLLIVLCALRCAAAADYLSAIRCYDDKGRAQRCIPPFENAAFGLEPEATNTCGENGPIEYCVMTSTQGIKPGCSMCNSKDEHSAVFMTDYSKSTSSITWWQSETMYEGIQGPNPVNITLRFDKAFDITHITIKFKSPRPHSFAIFKKTSQNDNWIPYQYYSANCMEMYNVSDQGYVKPYEVDTKALCTSELSDMAPLTGGSVPFSTLEGRLNLTFYDQRPELWDWVSATDIRIVLNRLNTFGDDLLRNPTVLKSYFYAISDIDIGARCKCNGHASECKRIKNNSSFKRFCHCEHNTTGPDCNQCLPFYNDAPWRRASAEDAYECRACNCNGFSTRCYFDRELYDQTGHGGHCLECAKNRDGPNCERCLPNYYQPTGETACYPCNCNETGSWNLQCNTEGKCLCKNGVTGDKCDHCDNNYYEFGAQGCKACGCNVAGSYNNKASCDPNTGTCRCKENVEGKLCSSCKPGFFNLDESDEFGCTPCFCYGHSSVCSSAPGYSKVTTESGFVRGNEKWNAVGISGRSYPVTYNALVQALEITAPASDILYFVASDRYLGNQRASYNHDLSFKLRIGNAAPTPTIYDIILEGAGLSISQPIFGHGNPLPTVTSQEYKFRLHEHSDYGWQPKLTTRDFMSLLSNLTSVKIRGTYSPQGVGYLDEVSLETARRGAAGIPATWVEMCSCPEGYVGQHCESCLPGSKHQPVSGGAFAPCVPCDCNHHAKICDADTGRCICEHNTVGENCERCASGYYGNALQGLPTDCQACPCPNGGPCTVFDDLVMCTKCPTGYIGYRCEMCSDGYFGDPSNETGVSSFCQLCDCNGNIDTNAIGNCNRTSGECLKCIYNTGGSHCEQCLPGYYGDALAVNAGSNKCKQCQCYPYGTLELDSGALQCDQLSGKCECKPYVTGNNCDQCQDGYYNLASGDGCKSCDCDPVGSLNNTCDINTGQCNCREGVTGLHCDMCVVYHYGFSVNGCKSCDCDPIGAFSLQCDYRGQCPCHENVEGRKCDRCKENKYDKQRNCVNCPDCYNLVKEATDSHRANLRYLEETISNITNVDTLPLDKDFVTKLNEVYQKIEKLEDDVKKATGGANEGKAISGKLGELYKKLDEISNSSKEISNMTNEAKKVVDEAESNITAIEQIIEQSQQSLLNSEVYLFTEGKSALAKAIAKSLQVGNQSDQMSKIARDARTLVQKLEEDSEKLKSIAEKAANISNEAYNKTFEASNKLQATTEELKSLNVVFMGEKLNVTIEQVAEARDQVNLAHSEALSILGDVSSLSIPTIDLAAIKENLTRYGQEATRIESEASQLLQDNAELLNISNIQLGLAETVLQRGIEQQQIADDMLAEVDMANQRAKDAVKLGNKTLYEAQETYKTLQEFNNVVQESKDKANEALKEVPVILKSMEEAQNKIKNAEKSLEGAENNAKNASEAAQDAEQKYAQNASKEAYEIRKRAEDVLAGISSNLTKTAEEVKNKVSETTAKIEELNGTATSDHNTIVQTKEKVGQAKTNVAEVKKQLEKVEEDINNIAKELKNLPDIDEASLVRLAERYEAAQKLFEETKIDEEIEALRKIKYKQVQQINDYEEELQKLKKEVSNLDDIRAALPDGCFKKIALET